MRCVIVSPGKTLYDGDADAVLLPSVNGQLGIMKNHLPLLALLEGGIITIRNKEEKKEFTITDGFAHVEDNLVRIIAEASENIEEIDVSRAEEARSRAIKEMRELRSSESPEFMAAMMRLKRNELRLRAASHQSGARKKPVK